MSSSAQKVTHQGPPEPRLTVKYTAWRGRLGTPKSGRTRVVPMPGDLVEALRAWRLRSTGAVVFSNREDGVMSAMTAPNRALERALLRAGLRRIRFHDLRHTYASHLVLERRSLREVQLLMGHHSITTTERYAHIADDQLVAAVDVLDGLGEARSEGP